MNQIGHRFSRTHFLLYFGITLCLIGYAWFYFSALPIIPFHPDESTQIFTSTDVEDFFSNPWQLSYFSHQIPTARGLYRALDAPLTRVLIGIGRTLFNQAATPVDWDWSKSWEDNQSSGALPSAALLLVARLSVSFLFPFSLILFYLILLRINGKLTALLGVLFIAFNPSLLLHTRRSMAESALIFTILLVIFSWIYFPFGKKAWFLGLATSLAVNAKQSAIALLILIPFLLLLAPSDLRLKQRAIAITQFFLVFGVTAWLLNPFLWSEPYQASLFALRSRQDLLLRQVSEIRSLRPEFILDSIPDRLIGITAHLFFTPPAVADIGNYIENTAASEIAYFSNPINNLGSGMAVGGIFLALTLFGWLIGSMRILREFRKKPGVDALGFIWICGIAQILVNLAFFPIPFQRYSVTLIPYAAFWSAYGISMVLKSIFRGFLGKIKSSYGKSGGFYTLLRRQ